VIEPALALQVTPLLLLSFATVAINCCVNDEYTGAPAGPTVTEIGSTVNVPPWYQLQLL
jgi:hypothetical protein